ncbi:Os10g0578700 [Oryza sativa Japonica Group]|uniref:Os10g0578700 protein n=2 Tax=Oryza sativa subsp. japonica TaxID=39947 RepID=Q0IVC8_ORYSJ|nr:hypothetical protein EE612_052992 [Oryza sativa]BAF27337.1 Os10g0578700 [Oryza sativa Japonica Group]BAT12225.1 Os10g0578700 [Oryza sativa Japonica Group]|eukprot:NP_001065500.1 Os10g0578700 [Oryza sativa Japonica Group]
MAMAMNRSGLLQQGGEVDVVMLGSGWRRGRGCGLVGDGPLEGLVAEAAQHGLVDGGEVRAAAPEVVDPEQAAGAQHPVRVVPQELQRRLRDPAVHGVPRPHQVHGGVPHREALLQRRVQRHHPARRRRLRVGRPEVHSGGEHGGVGRPLEARRQRPRPAAHVQPQPDGPRAAERCQAQQLRHREVEGPLRPQEARGLRAREVEAERGREAGEGGAFGPRRPADGGVRERGEGIGGQIIQVVRRRDRR